MGLLLSKDGDCVELTQLLSEMTNQGNQSSRVSQATSIVGERRGGIEEFARI